MGDRADALYLRAVDEIDEIREEFTENGWTNFDGAGPCLCEWGAWTPGRSAWPSRTVRICPIPTHGDRDEAIAYRQEQLAEDDASHHADTERDA